MIKPLTYILIVVILFAIWLNRDIFMDKSPRVKPTIEEPLVVTNKHIKKHSPIIQQPILETNSTQESNLSQELKALLTQASKHFRNTEDAEAFKLYDEVIKKSENSNDPKILMLFANALFAKAMIHNIYPNNDTDAAIEDYEVILNKFKNSDNKELLQNYISAKIEQAKLLSKDDLLTAYNELIKKFKNDNRFENEIDEIMFNKSFALMGENDEEAMEVFDNIIAKYQAKGEKKLPEAVESSILNNIELSIITSNDDTQYVELANKYLTDSPHTKPLLDMLNIIKNAQELDQEDALAEWREEHPNYYFPDWDFSELKKWANNIESKETKKRILNYIGTFEKQKYSRNIYSDPYQNENSSNEIYENSEESTTYEAINDVEEEDSSHLYEPDPYTNSNTTIQAY